MRPIHLFYSWQSDRDSDVCRSFVRIALEEAIAALKVAHGIEIHLDSDTAGVPGTPNVSETILNKIRECEIFVGDVTFVAKTEGGKQIPNPNVLIEFGYARGVLSDAQILSVMNTAFGQPNDLPFDLAYLRHPTSYSMPEGAPKSVRRTERAAFAKRLVLPLKAIANRVLLVRAAAKPKDDEIAPARSLIADVLQLNGRGDVPVIVAGAKLMMQLATTPAARGVNLMPALINSVRPMFVPAGYKDKTDHIDVSQWAEFDHPRAVEGKPNPEARWYTRLLQFGALDASMTIGMRIDDDPTIVVDAGPIEARIVETAVRLGKIAAGIGLDGPLVINATLQNVQDVQIMARQRASRPLGAPFVSLGSVVLSDVSEITVDGLRPLLEAVWRAAGSDKGSPLFIDGTSAEEQEGLLASPVVISGREWR
ncbi:hypothetical protein GFL63_20960 [Rhizobium leguminosarum bv. viciae]|uniref:hypothetical protein n=1 Tax=Rhizobium leguminosarum TaxID=384 RepID=UPI001441FFA0|nr:hypothetical protein [Rhizobium leguminosarum]NKK01226.1 hypothetical protein [Rhizobium leguminosarum bv. viciae]